MIEPNELYTIADRMVEIYEKLNKWAVIDIAERIMEMQELELDNLPGTAQHLAWVANQSGMHYQDMLKQIERITDIGSEELHELFKKSAVKSVINDNEMYKRLGKENPTGIKAWDDLSDNNKQIVEDMYENTNKDLKNFTRTTARASQQQLHEALDIAYNEVILGYKSYDKAIADAIKKVAKKGTVVVYESGYKDSIETCIRRAIMTAINQTAGRISIKNALEIGAEYVRLSAHSDARVSATDKIANHKGWQGKVYKLEGKTKQYGNLFEETGFDYKGKKSNPLGLCGYNCRHTINAYFPEYEEPVATSQKEQQAEIEREEKAHEQQVKERETAREERALTREKEAFQAALKICENQKVKKELEKRKNEADSELKKLIEKHSETDIIKNIQMPTEISKISGITKDTEQEINKAFNLITEQYDIKLNKLVVESLGRGFENVPFQYVPLNIGGFLQSKLAINSDYYFNDSLEAYQARIMRNYNSGALAAKNIEDLIAHEMAHVMTFQHCETYGEFTRLEEEVRESFVKGMSLYADSTFDGAEVIAEAFIRYRRGEQLPDNILSLINKYIERWRK